VTFQESELLHERVQAFVRGKSTEDFATLAFAIAEFQRRHSPGFARLLKARKLELSMGGLIPGVPSEAFRMTRVAVHAEALDRARFMTSGTTGSASGVHAFRTTQTYREIAVTFGRQALASALPGPYVVVALAPRLEEPPTSSLGYMMRMFIEEFDGRSLFAHSAFDALEAERWLIDADGINVGRLRRAAELAIERDEPLLILATSFALVGLLDAIGDAQIKVPARSVIMQTGGFKGRTREVAADELRRAVAGVFGISEAQIVSEYGMTELTSQLYEGCLPDGTLGRERKETAPGIYLEPAWLRVTPVDPITLDPVPDGEIGLAHFTDLGNVDSAVAVLTQDRVRRKGAGVELLGREVGAPARGCSLAIETFLQARA
jgi:hypothetical protein